ncbi:MAG: ABC transporter permease [Chitinophagaceae bacterium]|nr:ABC transporter permease [Chitinophagaceae bacterium]
MIANYLRIAIRNLWKRKVYTGINLLGLSIASAFGLLMALYLQHELSYDRFHKNAGELYRLEATNFFNPKKDEEKKTGFFASLLPAIAKERNMLVMPMVLGSDIKAAFPEVENVMRVMGSSDALVWINGESFKMEDKSTAEVDADFFKIFDFPLVSGNANNVLNGKNDVVISEKIAKRFFGKDNAVGKTFKLANDSSRIYTITGVMKDFPSNSSLKYEMIFPIAGDPGYIEDMADRSNNHYKTVTLLQFRKGTDMKQFNAKLETFTQKYFAETIKGMNEDGPDKKKEEFHLSLMPFAQAHYSDSNPWGHFTNLEHIYQLITLALIILIIACVNYILLTLTHTVTRSQEVGVRKTMGAGRKHIVGQFLVETQLLITIALLAGFMLAIIVMPLFNQISGATLSAADLSISFFLKGGLILFVVLGLLAGIYPAFVMSGMKPLSMMRKFSSVKLSPLLSRTLVVVQYATCILLIISSIVISNQMRYMNALELGFDKEQVLLLENPYEYDDPQRQQFAERFAHYTSTEPAIENVTFANFKFGSGFNMNGHLINGQREMIFQIPMDYNFFEFSKIGMVKGRFFDRTMPTDSARLELTEDQFTKGASSVRKPIVVNETLYKLLGNPPLNEINKAMGAPIIGVSKDFHFWNATQKIPPAYMLVGSRWGYAFAYVKIKKGQPLPDIINKIGANWNTMTGKLPMTLSFQDEEVKKGYESFTTWLHTVNVATILAVIIACMGLFGLSALYAVNRTKEIGIRKVMGASVSSLFMLLNKEVFWLTLISFVIAVPLALYFLNGWLENFVFRIKIGWVIFLVAGLVGLLLAIIAVSYHSLRAATSNPVKALRTE